MNILFITLSIMAITLIGCSSTSSQKIYSEEEIKILKEQSAVIRKTSIDQAWKQFLDNKISASTTSKDEIYQYLIRENSEEITNLENFAAEFLPNSYLKYKTIKQKNIHFESENLYKDSIISTSNNSELNVNKDNFIDSLINELRLQMDIADLYLRYKIESISKEKLQEFDNLEHLYTEGILHRKYDVLLDGEILKKDNCIEFSYNFLPNTYTILSELEANINQIKTEFDYILNLAEQLKISNLNSCPDALYICKFKYLKYVQLYNDIILNIQNNENSFLNEYITTDDLLIVDDDITEQYNKFLESFSEYTKIIYSLDYQGFVIVNILSSMVNIPGKNFLVNKYEITQFQWEIIMGYNPSYFKGPNRPVENISLEECQQFIEILNANLEIQLLGYNFSLPTREEWEYACKAGGGNFGLTLESEEGNIEDMGWYNRNSNKQTHDVGQKMPNAYGLYDMHGNVWEWTNTTSGPFYVRCGGSWENNAHFCRSYSYGVDPGSTKSRILGFRLLATQNTEN